MRDAAWKQNRENGGEEVVGGLEQKGGYLLPQRVCLRPPHTTLLRKMHQMF